MDLKVKARLFENLIIQSFHQIRVGPKFTPDEGPIKYHQAADELKI